MAGAARRGSLGVRSRWRTSTGWLRPLPRMIGAPGPSVAAEQGGDGLRVQRRGHHQDAQVLAQRGRVQRQGEAEVGIEAALVELVEDQQADAASSGSDWMRRVRMPSVST
jgi:hypothetical protein